MTVIQSHINLDVPGLRAFEFSSNGSAWTTAEIGSGYVRFAAWLALIDAQITGYSVSYSSTPDRVVFTPAGGATHLYFRFSESMAEALGWPTTSAKITTATEGTAAPAGVVPIKGLEVADPTPARQPDLRAYRHGLARSSVWGSGRLYRLKMLVDYADLSRLYGGPCSTGRIRVGDYASATAYASDELGGHIDGHLLRVTGGESIDTVEKLGAVTMEIHELQTYTAPDPFSAPFASLERGYSWALYVLIEGVAFRFCEIDPSIADAARTVADALVVDPRLSLQTRADRSKGIAGSSPIRFGVHDPDGELAIWGRPTKIAELEQDASHTDTTIRVKSATGWASSGSFYLGKERITYTGTDTTSTPHSFTGCTRGAVNSSYTHPAAGGAVFVSAVDRVHCWAGRFCELWAMVVDPFGRPCSDAHTAAAWEDGRCVQLFRGELTGAPSYDHGVWTFHADPIEKRLSRELAAEGTGKILDYQPDTSSASSTYYMKDETTGFLAEKGVAVPPIVVHKDDAFEVDFTWNEPGSASKTAGIYTATSSATLDDVATASGSYLTKIATSGDYWAVDLPDLFQSVVDHANSMTATAYPEKVDNFTSAQLTVANMLGQAIQCANFRVDEGGDFVVRCHTTFSSPYQAVTISIRPAGGLSYWKNPIVIDYTTTAGNDLGQSKHSSWQSTGASGARVDSVAVSIDTDGSDPFGSFPATGHYVAEGESDELGEYGAKMEITSRGCVILYRLTRGLEGTPNQNFFDPSVTVSAAEAYTGSYGSQLLTVLQSSGTTARGTYDTKGAHAGYGLEDGEIAEATFDAIPKISTTTIHAGRASLSKIYGGALAALSRNIGPVRSGQDLAIGVFKTRPAGFPTMKIRDSDIRRGRAPSVERLSAGPNIVEIKQSKAPGLEKERSITYRVLSDITARGGVRQSYSLPGLSSLAFESLATFAAASLVMSSADLVCYRVSVAPTKDYLAGQIVDIDTTHPALFDYKTHEPGLKAYGVILEARRNLGGEVDLVIMCAGAGLPAALVPAARIESLAGSVATLETSTFPTGAALFRQGDPVLLYRPGTTDRTETTISSISGDEVTLAAVPSWLSSLTLSATTGAAYIAYPQDDNASATAEQLAFSHVADGSTWS